MAPLSKNKPDMQKAFLKVYDLYASKIYQHVYFRVSSKEIAEDIVSNVFLKTWEYSKDNKIDNFKSFLYRVANNLVIDFYRQKDKNKTQYLEEAGYYDVAAENTDLDVKIDRDTNLEEIKRIISKLNSEMRDVLIMRYIDGFSVKEVSGIMEKSENSIYITTHRALKKLGELIKTNPKLIEANIKIDKKEA